MWNPYRAGMLPSDLWRGSMVGEGAARGRGGRSWRYEKGGPQAELKCPAREMVMRPDRASRFGRTSYGGGVGP